MMSTRRTLHRLVGLVAVLLTAACGINADTTPVDLEQPDAVITTIGQGTNTVEAIGSGRIYLLAPDLPGRADRLEAVPRETGDAPSAIIDALLAGPSEDEFGIGFRSLLPAALRANDVALRTGGVLAVDLSAPILDIAGDDLPLALAQIVHSLTAVRGITGVLITVEGQATPWPLPSGELVEGPLTAYDFPGLIDSVQPAYPSTPSP
jgi:hypothetical protein